MRRSARCILNWHGYENSTVLSEPRRSLYLDYSIHFPYDGVAFDHSFGFGFPVAEKE